MTTDCHHDHQNHQHNTQRNTAFYAAIFVFLFGIVEALFGIWSGSLTLLSDAGHMFADALALILAAFATWFSKRPATSKHTYGFGRIEVIVSWLSSMLLLAMIVSIAIEAINRLHAPHIIATKPVIIVATIGLMINIITAWILHQGEKNLNMQAALLHVFGDLLGSLAVLVSGIVIYFTNWTKIDPILSLVICLLILISTLRLLRESLLILMEGAPSHIDTTKVEATMKKIAGIQTVHDLHIWTLTSGKSLLTAHVVIDDCSLWPQTIDNLRTAINQEFGITHTTIQAESTNQTIACTNCHQQ